MTLYSPTTGATLLTGATDADGDTITVRKINGVNIDWATNPQTVTLTVGLVKVWQDGTVRFDDTGLGAGRPAAGASVAAGSFTFTLWDGVDESPAYTATIGLAAPAAADSTDPAVTSMSPAAGSTGVLRGVTITVNLSEECQFGPGNIELWNATDVTLIEAIPTTATGPGPGTVTMGSAAFAIQPTALLPESKQVALRWSAGVVRDLAGRSLPAATGSALAFTVVDPVLTNTSPVNFTGTPTVGSTLTVVPGAWSGAASITLTYQWFRNGVAIPGATASTYVLAPADANNTVTVQETATAGTNPPAPVAVMASGILITAPANIRSQIEDQVFSAWATYGWEGFTDTAGFTTFTETTPDAVKVRYDAWRNGTPGTSKVLVYCDWDGVLNASSTGWSGVASGKLTANAAAFSGYNLPANGGFWLRAAPGKRPKWGTILKITGPMRLHIDGVAWCGQSNGAAGDNLRSLQITRSATFPLAGQIVLTSGNFGHMDNKPGLAWTEMIKGLEANDVQSLYLRGNRFAGLRDQVISTALVRKMEYNDFQDSISDVSASFGFKNGAIWAGRTAYDWDQLNLVRDLRQEVNAAGLHTDRSQKGTAADVHAGYVTLHRWNLTHMKSAVAFDSQTQGLYQDDATTQRFDAVHYDNLQAVSGYHSSTAYDCTGFGNHWGERLTLLRAGDYYSTDPLPWFTLSNAPYSKIGANGGTVMAKDSVIGRFSNPSNFAYTADNIKYVTPVKNAAGGNGASAATAMRMETYLKPGRVSRDGADKMTYSISGENDPDFATAWHAIRDFFEPADGYNTGAGFGCTDPATWPGAPARP